MAELLLPLPGWLRPLEVGLGLIYLVIALVALLNFGLSLLFIVLLLAASLVLRGLDRVIEGVLMKTSGRRRPLMIAAGIGLMGLGAISLINPGLTIDVVVILLGIGLITLGCIKAAIGLSDPISTQPLRAVVVILAVLMVLLGFAVTVFPIFARQVLVAMLAIGIVMDAGEYLSAGFTGYRSFEISDDEEEEDIG